MSSYTPDPAVTVTPVLPEDASKLGTPSQMNSDGTYAHAVWHPLEDLELMMEHEGERTTVPVEPDEPDYTVPMHEDEDGNITAGLDTDVDEDADATDAVPAEAQDDDAYAEDDADDGPEADPDYFPDTPGGYCVPSIPGFDWAEVREREGEFVRQYLAVLHEGGVKQGTVSQLLEIFAHNRMYADQLYAERDRAQAKATEAQLRRELGDIEFRRQVNLTNAILQDATLFEEGAGAAIMRARDVDGSRLISNPNVMKAIAKYAERNILRYNVEARGSLHDERAAIEALMDRDIDAYHHEKGWGDRGDQTAAQRYGEVLRALASRAA
jgi:hypothetical protein